MDLADRDRALADCGGDALDRATAYVAHGGHASAAGLEHAVVAVGGGSVSTKPFASSGISPWSQLVWGRTDQQDRAVVATRCFSPVWRLCTSTS